MPNSATRYDVFLSHNHADQPAVADLAHRLVEAGLRPWFAASHLIPGEPWQEAMEAALGASETVAVFVGPQGMGPWHNEEMRVAIEDAVQNGKRVIPVLLPGADPERINRILKRRTWVDFRPGLGDAGAFQSLLAGVRGETPFEAAGLFGFGWRRRRDFYRHIPLPPNYIPRPELLAEVRERLLAGTGGLTLTSAIQVRQADVLHGMGGIGKSVLARALCDDPEVQAAFPDGILWATLGQTPDLTARLREWIETLGGVVSQTAPTPDQLRNALAEALRDKACLLIADDAWRKAHLEPFGAGGPACRLLITTRDAALADGLNAGVYPVPVMAPDQAVSLLEEWAQGGLAEAEAVVKAQIVRRLGCLPLAVRLAGAQLRTEDPAEWLASFDARKLKNRRVETVHDSLEATFGLSLDALEPADRRLYVALAIFKEDEPIPVVAIARLWSELAGRDSDETSELLDDLADQVLMARSRADGDTVTFHDLLRDFMAAELGEAGALAAHRALVDTYRPTGTGAGWATAPDDGYLYDHLVYHLDRLAAAEDGAAAELQSLFADDAWLHARVSGAGYLYDGYLADLDAAWERMHQKTLGQIEAGEAPAAFAGCVRYALIKTSLNSLSSNYKPVFVARAVETGLWSAERALSAANRIPDPRARAGMLTALIAVTGMRAEMRALIGQSALAAALAIGYEGSRAKALAALAPQLVGEEKTTALTQALAAARTIQNEGDRARALAALAPQLVGEEKTTALTQALAAARVIEDEDDRAEALAALAPQLVGEEKTTALTQALAAAQVIRYEDSRAKALAALAPQLMGDLLAQALAAARAIEDECYRAEVLAALAPQLPGDLLAQALAAALAIQDEYSRAEALAALAPQLTDELQELALSSMQTMDDDTLRAWVFAAFLPHLSAPDRHLGTVRRAIADGLRKGLAVQKREDLLRFIADDTLFAPPILSSETLAAIARHIIEICTEWEWL